ncbi:MAG: tRNA (N(6)-L-threonylcarbamoyladenosine(37)-C(2))-methylthiotransferase MtaB [Proteobacteria bacterium]|nr:tRNA (N(6)-L-threonylcarbamoyladenosine(37)-C(2))-methylthiotransferase MtaB [Pseudomonadota bacterium]
MKQAAVITLGCKVNAFDTALLWEDLERRGYSVIGEVGMADLYVINTCTVTNNAGSQSRQMVRKVKRINPASKVIVTGCHAQVSADEVAKIEGVDYVVGNNEKGRLVEIIDLEDKREVSRVVVGNIFDEKRLSQRRISRFQRKSRAVLKVQDGCEAFCSYCIIPYARGLSRSLPMEEVEEQVLALAESGYSEIVLTGIHIGGYGLDLPEKRTFLDLLKRLDSLDIDMRYRISSIEPTEIDDTMLDFLVSSKKICRHLHIPLQSGDEATLKRMERTYTPDDYLKRVQRIAERWEGVGIGIDIIAGFPGEDRKAFMNSYDLIKASPASYLHVFPYSKRDGTPAADMQGHVSPAEIKERCAALRALGEEKKEAFARNNVGKVLPSVMLEGKGDDMKSLTDNYLNVVLEKSDVKGAIKGSGIFPVNIRSYRDGRCYGSLV